MADISNKHNLAQNKKRLKNIRHEGFCRSYIENNGNGTQAYMENYPLASKNCANKNSSKLLTKKDVRNRITELLEDKSGSRISVLLSDLIELKNAQRPIVVDKVIKFTKDNGVALESVKTLLKLHGLLQPSAQVSDNRSVTVNYNTADIKEIKDIVQDLKSIRDRDDIISGKVL